MVEWIFKRITRTPSVQKIYWRCSNDNLKRCKWRTGKLSNYLKAKTLNESWTKDYVESTSKQLYSVKLINKNQCTVKLTFVSDKNYTRRLWIVTQDYIVDMLREQKTL